MALDPIKTTKEITESYLGYLATTFQLSDSSLNSQFKESLQADDRFVKGPILEATPPFETGRSIEEMVDDGLLSKLFRDLETEKLPIDRPLYMHQEKAIEKCVQKNRNIVVATGTGSGKTEAFLVPILNHLFNQFENRKLDHGVRALLLYPMNALANDQLARLRESLANVDYITFGRYTGETLEDYDKARKQYQKMYFREPLENELISREQMRNSPPHILLTNYAMLEYLLLRPNDHVFFDGDYAHEWQFIVVDEAHTFKGASGIEMAMLLRRLKDRILGGQKRKLTCIATSATIGSDEKHLPDVAKFASKLFDEQFAWIPGDPSAQDVIVSTRKPLNEISKINWAPNPKVYLQWQEIINSDETTDNLERLFEIGYHAGIPENILEKGKQTAEENKSIHPFLYECLRGDVNLIRLREDLEREPQYLGKISEIIITNIDEPIKYLVALVDLATKAKLADEDLPLLPARYHLFVRAIEGAYISIKPEIKLYLDRRESVIIDEKSYTVFEIATCRQCNTPYIVGETEIIDNITFLKQPGKNYYENPGKLEFYFLPSDDYSDLPTDEDEQTQFGDEIEIEYEEYKLCAACGAIDKTNLITPLCSCGDEQIIKVIHVPSKQGIVYSCKSCGSMSPSGLVWRFFTGNDATASVLATSLYQELPKKYQAKKQNNNLNQSTPDPWSRRIDAIEAEVYKQIHQNTNGRQLLIFSDSRQDAAFFAPYLERTYSQILRRRIILEVLQDEKDKAISNEWRIQDLVNPLIRNTNRKLIFEGLSNQQKEAEVWKWLLYELLAFDRRNSLEGLGLLGYSVIFPDTWSPFQYFKNNGFSDDEVKTLYQVLLSSFRVKGALLFPNEVPPTDNFFAPRNRECYFVNKKPEGIITPTYIYGWLPTKHRGINNRIDYLQRIFQYGFGVDNNYEKCNELLNAIWTYDLFPTNNDSIWKNYFSITMRDGQTKYQMKPEYWKLNPAIIDQSIKWFICDKCNNITLFNLRNICPTYKCSGRLHELNPEETFKENHYRKLYTEIAPFRLNAREHTAQLTSERAAELQSEFIRGDVNVLSCSTTFELGVDVGDLESVFMRNMPPSTANYVQRAGRAGRRTDSTAFSLTFAQRRSHDLSYYNEPLNMVKGEIKAPYFDLVNEKIIRRHVHATALATFWKEHEDYFGKVETFFFHDELSGPQLFYNYLSQKPTHLLTSLRRIVPQELHDEIELNTWGWISEMYDKEIGSITLADERVKNDVEQLEIKRNELVSAHKPSDFIIRVIKTIKDEYLLSSQSR